MAAKIEVDKALCKTYGSLPSTKLEYRCASPQHNYLGFHPIMSRQIAQDLVRLKANMHRVLSLYTNLEKTSSSTLSTPGRRDVSPLIVDDGILIKRHAVGGSSNFVLQSRIPRP